jgi:hypothetical protein
MINENQERFVQMLNDPNLETGSGGGGQQAQGSASGMGGAPGMETGYIQVTPEEKQAIERVSITLTYQRIIYFFIFCPFSYGPLASQRACASKLTLHVKRMKI